MPVKTIICSQCGQEVTKRQSRLVGDKRICKTHDEAVEFAETQRKKDLEKALKDRQWKKPQRSRRNYDVFDTEVSPMRQLAAFAVLGKMHREQQERNQLAREMMACSFKAIMIATFLDVAVDNAVMSSPELAKMTKEIADKKFKEILDDLDVSYEAHIILSNILFEATEGLADNLAMRLVTSISEIPKILDEHKALLEKDEEIREKLGALL